MKIESGPITRSKRTVIYGGAGMGKTTLAAQIPGAVFIDLEHGTDFYDVQRAETPLTWPELLSAVKSLSGMAKVNAIVIDTADAAERLCIEHICDKNAKQDIAGWDHGKGYCILESEFGKLLDLLTTSATKCGKEIVILAHGRYRTISKPQEADGFDRNALKLEKKTSSLLEEWSDEMFFIDSAIDVVHGADGSKKASNPVRTLYTGINPCWVSKTRCAYENKYPIPDIKEAKKLAAVIWKPKAKQEKKKEPEKAEVQKERAVDEETLGGKTRTEWIASAHRLMLQEGLTEEDVQKQVAANGWRPVTMQMKDYPLELFAKGIIGSWDKFLAAIKEGRKTS